MILTENHIKEEALKYLREYYKYRDRHPEGFFETKSSQVTQSGIIADGLISFKQMDNTVFTATIEATSIAKEEEIRYRRLNKLLALDALTASFMATALLMVLLYSSKILVPIIGNYYAFGSLVFLALFGFFFLAWLVLSRFRRYRYIYSIEQFRQYEVDEQWIAYDASIFPDYGNTFHDELKKQCYKWGIGLLQVKPNSIYALITPSRDGEFGKRTKEAFFKSGTIIPKLSSSSFAKQIMRYRKGAFNQFFIMAAALLILGFVSFRFYQESPYEYWDVERLNQQAQVVDDFGPEELNSWVEPEYITPFQEKVKPYLSSNATIFVQKTKTKAPKVFVLTDSKFSKKYQPINNQNLSCNGIPGADDDDFIIQLGAYKSTQNARHRIKELNEVGITAEIYGCGCLGSKSQLNCVLFVHAYAIPDQAIKKMKAFEKKLTNSAVPVGEIWIRPVKKLHF